MSFTIEYRHCKEGGMTDTVLIFPPELLKAPYQKANTLVWTARSDNVAFNASSVSDPLNVTENTVAYGYIETNLLVSASLTDDIVHQLCAKGILTNSALLLSIQETLKNLLTNSPSKCSTAEKHALDQIQQQESWF